ncbi:hypothetical protein Lepil_3473 [Leptonema illini DSM 21528]|uniref:Uncharacterized protein n=2 Tax=Leptonema illini TaxID=183 RepID=H2CIW4_9LEPT|nr:hypothetical protein Lepil_3473 [Leptonema illini DSM 21528]
MSMNRIEQELYRRLLDFRLDEPGVPFAYSDRLARENGWSMAYTFRVIAEYRKFLFLCCVMETNPTPSDQVDQAWHLHLLYTKSYWIDLCRHTIGRELHHIPTEGRQERQRFVEQYLKTLDTYRQYFGNPPADVWPDEKTRFASIRWMRINLHTYIPVRRLWKIF